MQRDKRGRRIGYNWWRSMNVELLTLDTLRWEEKYEAESFPTEREEYEAEYPKPNLKHFLIHNKGMGRRS